MPFGLVAAGIAAAAAGAAATAATSGAAAADADRKRKERFEKSQSRMADIWGSAGDQYGGVYDDMYQRGTRDTQGAAMHQAMMLAGQGGTAGGQAAARRAAQMQGPAAAAQAQLAGHAIADEYTRGVQNQARLGQTQFAQQMAEDTGDAEAIWGSLGQIGPAVSEIGQAAGRGMKGGAQAGMLYDSDSRAKNVYSDEQTKRFNRKVGHTIPAGADVMSDERSKQRIKELEARLAQYEGVDPNQAASTMRDEAYQQSEENPEHKGMLGRSSIFGDLPYEPRPELGEGWIERDLAADEAEAQRLQASLDAQAAQPPQDDTPRSFEMAEEKRRAAEAEQPGVLENLYDRVFSDERGKRIDGANVLSDENVKMRAGRVTSEVPFQSWGQNIQDMQASAQQADLKQDRQRWGRESADFRAGLTNAPTGGGFRRERKTGETSPTAARGAANQPVATVVSDERAKQQAYMQGYRSVMSDERAKQQAFAQGQQDARSGVRAPGTATRQDTGLRSLAVRDPEAYRAQPTADDLEFWKGSGMSHPQSARRGRGVWTNEWQDRSPDYWEGRDTTKRLGPVISNRDAMLREIDPMADIPPELAEERDRMIRGAAVAKGGQRGLRADERFDPQNDVLREAAEEQVAREREAARGFQVDQTAREFEDFLKKRKEAAGTGTGTGKRRRKPTKPKPATPAGARQPGFPAEAARVSGRDKAYTSPEDKAYEAEIEQASKARGGAEALRKIEREDELRRAGEPIATAAERKAAREYVESGAAEAARKADRRRKLSRAASYALAPMEVMFSPATLAARLFKDSDERGKNVMEDGDASEMVRNTPGSYFEYKDEFVSRPGAEPGLQYGIMAQDLEKSPVGETLVDEDETGMKQVNTGRLSMVNTAALNEVLARLDRLEGKRRKA